MTTGLRRLTAIATLECELHVETGLRIGGTESGIAIGGLDNPVIRDPITNRPYVPGSSLKGKMRSLLERRLELEQNWSISDIHIHVCRTQDNYANCDVCQVFGIPAPRQSWFCQTRVRVFDAFLSEESVAALDNSRTDLPYTEVKTEVAIDRVTAAATPRSMERVPAGAVFAPVTISLHRYDGDSPRLFGLLLDGLAMVEADYLGGSGSRGSGRVSFRTIAVRKLGFGRDGDTFSREFPGGFPRLADLSAAREQLEEWLGEAA